MLGEIGVGIVKYGGGMLPVLRYLIDWVRIKVAVADLERQCEALLAQLAESEEGRRGVE